MRKKEHISNCEIAKKIIPFYNSYNYAGLKSKGNAYVNDDFCVSDNEYEDDISNSEYNSQNIEEREVNLDNEDLYITDKNNYQYEEPTLTNYQDNSFYSQESITQNGKEKRNNKKKKNVILESSYNSEDSNSENYIENENKENKYSNNDYNIINSSHNVSDSKNNYDIFNDLDSFSSSPVLPSIDACMDKLFNNHTTPQKNKNNSKKNKNENNTDDFIISEELLGNKGKDSPKIESIAVSENYNNLINDPLNLFSNDIEEPLSNIIKKQKNELKYSKKTKNKIHYPTTINDEFTIDENLLGTKKKSKNEYNESSIDNIDDDDLFGSTSLNSQKLNNDIISPIITGEIEKPLSNLFSNNMDNSSNHITSTSKKGKEKISSKNSKNKGKSNNTVDKNGSIYNKGTYSKNNVDYDNDDNDNNNNLMSDPNDEIEDLLNLFSNDIKDSSVIDSDEEFIMSSNNGNNNKVNVKSLYTNDIINNNENETILDKCLNSNDDDDNNSIYEFNNSEGLFTNNIAKSNEEELILDNSIKNNNDEEEDEDVFGFNNNKDKDKVEAENKLIHLFDNDEINVEMNYESDDDIFDEQKKYFKQASLTELMEKKKSKDENDLINFFTSKNERKNKLLQDSQNNNDDKLFNLNIFNCSNKEKKSLTLSHSRPRKTKLDFYFKELPSSSTSSSTFTKSFKGNESSTSFAPSNSSKSLRVNEINNNSTVDKESSLFYNVSKNRKRSNEEDNIIKNPFIISKKQKLENKILADKYNEHNQLNNVLLKFESNEKPKASQTSLFDQLSSNKKQKRQVSLLSLFSSQNDNKNKKVLSPVKPEIYNSIITNITKPKKVNHQDFHKARSSNSNVRIRNRQNKLSMEKINYIKPSVYILTCEKKELPNYHNPNINKRGINHPKPINIFDCQEVKYSFRPSNKKVVSENYDLMKEHLIKKREHSLVNSFITSFEDSSHKNKNNSTWPPIGWNNYFQNSIANSF